MQILKFGGTSLANAAAIQHVASLVREHSAEKETLLVCSACAGVTNRLVRLARLLRTGDFAPALAEACAIHAKHRAILDLLGASASADAPSDFSHARAGLDALGASLQSLVMEIEPSEFDPSWIDSVLSYGERASVRLVTAALQIAGARAEAVDATRFVVTTGEFGNAAPLREETRRRARQIISPLLAQGIIPVVTGFIGATLDGETTTLGRNSSDFSAAIVADALDAAEVWIWTDVDGVYDRDPAASEILGLDFTLIEEMSYDEALFLAQNGAKVLHPKTIEPLKEKNIALRIRNTFRPEHSGTLIGPASARPARLGASPLVQGASR
jgi:aspartokinase/homoserine dehydrogenase 1